MVVGHGTYKTVKARLWPELSGPDSSLGFQGQIMALAFKAIFWPLISRPEFGLGDQAKLLWEGARPRRRIRGRCPAARSSLPWPGLRLGVGHVQG